MRNVSNEKIDDKELPDAEFQHRFQKRTQEERDDLQLRYGSFIAYLEIKDRIADIAKDIDQPH